MTVDFGETVTGFDASDLVVTNGAAGVVSGGPQTYTVDVTPGSQGLVTIDIAGAVATDAAGNPNAAATQFSITYDFNDPPTVANAIPNQLAFEDNSLFLRLRGQHIRRCRR